MAKHILAILSLCFCLCGCAVRDDQAEQYLVADIEYASQEVSESVVHSRLYGRVKDWIQREDTSEYEAVGNQCDYLIAKVAMLEALSYVFYVSDSENDYDWKTTHETLDTRMGDCEEIATLAQRFALESGMGREYIFIGVFEDGKNGHVSLCYMPDRDRSNFIGLSMPIGYTFRPIAGLTLTEYWEYRNF